MERIVFKKIYARKAYDLFFYALVFFIFFILFFIAAIFGPHKEKILELSSDVYFVYIIFGVNFTFIAILLFFAFKNFFKIRNIIEKGILTEAQIFKIEKKPPWYYKYNRKKVYITYIFKTKTDDVKSIISFPEHLKDYNIFKKGEKGKVVYNPENSDENILLIPD